MRGSIWSPDPQYLFDLDRVLDEDRNNIYDLYQYDIDQDTIELIYSFGNIGREQLTTDEDSLSVNGLLAIGHSIPIERDEFPKLEKYLELLDISTGELLKTCFFARPTSGTSIAVFDFEWSLDGRYLAFFGAPQSEENGGIYIYDTETQITYSAYSGSADIVGWSSISNNEER